MIKALCLNNDDLTISWEWLFQSKLSLNALLFGDFRSRHVWSVFESVNELETVLAFCVLLYEDSLLDFIV